MKVGCRRFSIMCQSPLSVLFSADLPPPPPPGIGGCSIGMWGGGVWGGGGGGGLHKLVVSKIKSRCFWNFSRLTDSI